MELAFFFISVKSVPKEELVACIPVLLANLEDRNADVRKNAADAVLGVMIHTNYGPLYSACDKLKVCILYCKHC